MTPLSYHSSNLSLIALETMRLLVQISNIDSQNSILKWQPVQINIPPSLLLMSFWEWSWRKITN